MFVLFKGTAEKLSTFIFKNEGFVKKRFKVLTVVSMKTTVFWDIVPCSLVEIDQCV
jgi:hypothetical protein